MTSFWRSLNQDGTKITIERFNGEFSLPKFDGLESLKSGGPSWRSGICVDVETTGLDRYRDTIIEIAIRAFAFDSASDEIVAIGPSFSALNDPAKPIAAEITKLTGIRDKDVEGQSIDVAEVVRYFSAADLVVAHNAGFDRKFIDRWIRTNIDDEDALAACTQNVWACSCDFIPWRNFGFPVHKLELLGPFHGFFVNGHRALEDVDALLHLLTFSEPTSDSTYFSTMVKKARLSSFKICATGAPFDSKDALKSRRYRWNAGNKVWEKTVLEPEKDAELEWLAAEVFTYGGEPDLYEIHPRKRFS